MVELPVAKKQSKVIAIITGLAIAFISVFAVAIPVEASTTTDVQIFEYGVGKVFMTYSSDVAASENLYNGTQPAYNLYEIPLNFSMFRGSNTTTSINYYTGWAYTQITLGLNRSTSSYIELVSQDPNVSIAYETVSQSSNNVIIGIFFAFDDLQVGRSASLGQLKLHSRYNTNSLSDTLSITAVSVANTVIHMAQNSVPTTNGSLVMSIVQALNNTSDIDTIISVLNAIKSNTDLYTQVTSQLTSISSGIAGVASGINDVNSGIDDVSSGIDSIHSAITASNPSQSVLDGGIGAITHGLADIAEEEDSILELAEGQGMADHWYALSSHLEDFTTDTAFTLSWWANLINDWSSASSWIWTTIIIVMTISMFAFILGLKR